VLVRVRARVLVRVLVRVWVLVRLLEFYCGKGVGGAHVVLCSKFTLLTFLTDMNDECGSLLWVGDLGDHCARMRSAQHTLTLPADLSVILHHNRVHVWARPL
jgi:hypothetical protein